MKPPEQTAEYYTIFRPHTVAESLESPPSSPTRSTLHHGSSRKPEALRQLLDILDLQNVSLSYLSGLSLTRSGGAMVSPHHRNNYDSEMRLCKNFTCLEAFEAILVKNVAQNCVKFVKHRFEGVIGRN